MSENQDMPLVIQDPVGDMQQVAISRPPNVVLEEARQAAMSLKQVIAMKPKPFVLNGEQYLEMEDWSLLGRFYGITAKIVEDSVRYLELEGAKGYEARAVAFHLPSGKEISAAEAMCLDNEPNWRGKPLFQLRSMAQTRACAKVLRNVLSWVVVLAGYKPTPAEEMIEHQARPLPAPPVAKQAGSEEVISEAQGKRLYAIWKSAGKHDEDVKAYLKQKYGYDSTKQIKKSEYDELVAAVQKEVLSF